MSLCLAERTLAQMINPGTIKTQAAGRLSTVKWTEKEAPALNTS